MVGGAGRHDDKVEKQGREEVVGWLGVGVEGWGGGGVYGREPELPNDG